MNKAEVEQMVKEGKSLVGANLCGADLKGVNLHGASLSVANLAGANLTRANLADVNLAGANLTGANLSDANLTGADLTLANLTGANLADANLARAVLRWADLADAVLPDFRVCPEKGEFIAWKKTTTGVIRLCIPADALRVNAIGSRKCRASKVIVLDGPGCGGESPTHMEEALVYDEGAEIVAPKFSDDIRVECAPGIHFFITRKEAEKWM